MSRLNKITLTAVTAVVLAADLSTRAALMLRRRRFHRKQFASLIKPGDRRLASSARIVGAQAEQSHVDHG